MAILEKGKPLWYLSKGKDKLNIQETKVGGRESFCRNFGKDNIASHSRELVLASS